MGMNRAKIAQRPQSENNIVLKKFYRKWRLFCFREALGNKAVKRSLHSDLFQMDVLGAD